MVNDGEQQMNGLRNPVEPSIPRVGGEDKIKNWFAIRLNTSYILIIQSLTDWDS
jgi:hypothetical protein